MQRQAARNASQYIPAGARALRRPGCAAPQPLPVRVTVTTGNGALWTLHAPLIRRYEEAQSSDCMASGTAGQHQSSCMHLVRDWPASPQRSPGSFAPRRFQQVGPAAARQAGGRTSWRLPVDVCQRDGCRNGLKSAECLLKTSWQLSDEVCCACKRGFGRAVLGLKHLLPAVCKGSSTSCSKSLSSPYRSCTV